MEILAVVASVVLFAYVFIKVHQEGKEHERNMAEIMERHEQEQNRKRG